MARIRVTETGPTRIKLKLDDWAVSATNRGNILVYDPSVVDGKESQLYCFNQKNMLIKIQNEEGPFMAISFVEMLS